MKEQKIIIIGGGPGGYVAAIRAAQLGASVTLIEKEKVGGTCLNVGCIPTKALLHSAEVYQTILHAENSGVSADGISFDFHKIQERKNAVVSQMTTGVKSLLKANSVRIVEGTASFADANTICVQTKEGTMELSGDRVIIAAGSIPAAPPIPGISGEHCIDSTGALALTEVPKSMIVIGGGVIGMEISSVFSAFGTKITVIEMMDEILPMMDKELVKPLRKKMKKEGIEIQTSARVISIEHTADHAEVHVEKNGQEMVFSGEKILVCIGRKANLEELKLENAGIKTENNVILVNDRLETNVAGIYAVGDCRGGIMLAHTASEQGEIAVENAMGMDRRYETNAVPSCVYTDPEIAAVGLTETEAKEQGIDCKVGRFPVMANGKCAAMGYKEGLVKLVVHAESNRILGVQIFAPRATDMIAECVLAVRKGLTAEEVIETIHAHPTVSEIIREAALDAEGRAIHIFRPR